MSINMRVLLPTAYLALKQLCEDRDWIDIHGYMEEEQAAWLTFLLQHVPDNEVAFPAGKWATIQRIQELCDEAAREEQNAD